MKRLSGLMLAGILSLPASAFAQDVGLTSDIASATITLGTGETLEISRIQDTSHRLSGEFTKTSRACPPFCIAEISAAPGVETVGELEVIDFIKSDVATGNGLLLDSRMPEWFAKGSIPGAINLPFSTLEESNPYRDDILKALGARETVNGFDYSGAKSLTLFCNGPWCDQSPRAIRSLRAAGYPTEKLHYYRGGMQLWLLLGLTVTTPSS